MAKGKKRQRLPNSEWEIECDEEGFWRAYPPNSPHLCIGTLWTEKQAWHIGTMLEDAYILGVENLRDEIKGALGV
jgi:hypothetical protein